MLEGSICGTTCVGGKGKYILLNDEATDCSMKGQLALILGLWAKKDIREEVLYFLECSYGLSGHSLYRTIKEFFVSVGIDISDCRGQGYDEAGAVAGKNQGLSAHVLRVIPKALYTHCSCHRLNLAVVAFCGEQGVRNLTTNIKEVSYFFNLSAPRKSCLEDKILLYCTESLKHELKDVCRTRWVKRIEGMDVFEELFVPVYYSLLVMKENNDTVHYNNETSAKAKSLFKLFNHFEFIVTLDYLLPVTRKLQAKDLDLAQSMDLIQNLKLTIAKLRNSIENYHENWYNKAKKLAEKVDISEPNMTKPRTCSRQIYQSNQPVQNTKEYFCISLTIPFLDHVSPDLDYRVPGDELTQYRGLYIILYVICNVK